MRAHNLKPETNRQPETKTKKSSSCECRISNYFFSPKFWVGFRTKIYYFSYPFPDLTPKVCTHKSVIIPYSRLKQLENHTLKCSTYPYSLYVGAPPSPRCLYHCNYSQLCPSNILLLLLLLLDRLFLSTRVLLIIEIVFDKVEFC